MSLTIGAGATGAKVEVSARAWYVRLTVTGTAYGTTTRTEIDLSPEQAREVAAALVHCSKEATDG